MKIKDILETKGANSESISPNATLKEAMDKIVDKKIGALLVMRGEELIGIITERDIFRRIALEGSGVLDTKVETSMTTNLIVGIPDDKIEIAMSYMTNNRFRHLPIMDGQNIAGIISIGDIVKAEVQNLKVENRYLYDYITGKYPG